MKQDKAFNFYFMTSLHIDLHLCPHICRAERIFHSVTFQRSAADEYREKMHQCVASVYTLFSFFSSCKGVKIVDKVVSHDTHEGFTLLQ